MSMQTKLIAVFLLQTSLLLQIPSTAIGQVPPEDCEIIDHHFSRPPPTDLGNGMVTTSSHPLAHSSGSFWYESRRVTGCASGDQLRIAFVDDSVPGEAGGFYVGPLPLEFEAQIANSVFASLSDIKREAERLGLQVTERNEPREVCGCAAFYPSLRGSKDAAWVPMAYLRSLRAEQPELDRTVRPFDRISFISERIDFNGPSSQIVSVHTPPARIGNTNIRSSGFRDFKNCTTNDAVRVHYNVRGDATEGLAGNSPLLNHGGMAAYRFEAALKALEDDETSLEQLSLLASSHGLSADVLPSAHENIDCDTLLGNEGLQLAD